MKQKGLPVNQEALFLLSFLSRADVHPTHAAVDLGCGSGLMTIALSKMYPGIKVTGYENQRKLVEAARGNLLLNSVSTHAAVECADIRKVDERPADLSCDLAVMNPPFRTAGSGRLSPDAIKRQANHEVTATLADFIRAASIALIHKGILATVMIPERFPELMAVMEERKTPAFAIQWIHHRPGAPANAALVLGRKGGRGGLMVHSPLFVTPAVD